MTKIYKAVDLTQDEIKQVLLIHRKELANDILPNLCDSYYIRIIINLCSGNHGSGYIAKNGSEVIGFIFTANKSSSILKILTKSPFLLLSSLIKIAAIKPILLVDMFGSIFGKTKYNKDTKSENLSEIFTLFLKKEYQGKGIGSELVTKSISDHEPILVKSSSPKAIEFYEKMGFKRIGVQDRIFRKLDILKYSAT